MATKNRKAQRDKQGLPIVHRHAAGIDIGATFHVVAVPLDTDEEPVRKFQSFTGDLVRLAEWLQHLGAGAQDGHERRAVDPTPP